MSRISVKVAGMQGSGINSIGEVIGKGLKRSGYCVFGYREYMSLIKGGHSSYQLDIDNRHIESTEARVDVMVAQDYYGLKENLGDIKDGGILVYRTPQWKFSEEDQKLLKRRKITQIYLPLEKVIKGLKAPSIVGNVIITAFVWKIIGQDIAILKRMIRAQFGHKKHLIGMNMDAIDAGVKLYKELGEGLHVQLPKPKEEFKKQMMLIGAEALGLGLVHAGCRMFMGYPMTPASPLLTYIASIQNRTNMVVKQAEDEITAAQMVTGSFFAGCRAATATAGGGIDLMSETISVNGIMENPCMLILAQRAGPGTGNPTWTGQGDLLIGAHAGHGEFPRCVMAVSGPTDCFSLAAEAFNIAEEYQMPVILMTDKQIQEGIYTEPFFDQKSTKIERGVVTSKAKLEKLTSYDRYDPTAKDGISPRWIPGTEAPTYVSQGDEHAGDGSVNETAENAIEQMDKRMKKMAALKKKLPEPVLYGDKNPDVLLIGWGSTKGVTLDALREMGNKSAKGKKIGYLHYEYLWPLRVGKLERLAKKAKKVIAIESSYQSQFQMIIGQESNTVFDKPILKYDGRPIFIDELISILNKRAS